MHSGPSEQGGLALPGVDYRERVPQARKRPEETSGPCRAPFTPHACGPLESRLEAAPEETRDSSGH